MRIISFIVMVVLSTLTPWWLWLLLASCYAYFWHGLELLLIGALVDAYFGTNGLPLYTLGLGGVLLTIEWLKPRLIIYNESYK